MYQRLNIYTTHPSRFTRGTIFVVEPGLTSLAMFQILEHEELVIARTDWEDAFQIDCYDPRLHNLVKVSGIWSYTRILDYHKTNPREQ